MFIVLVAHSMTHHTECYRVGAVPKQYVLKVNQGLFESVSRMHLGFLIGGLGFRV